VKILNTKRITAGPVSPVQGIVVSSLSETRFLEYRLEVVRTWRESGRKQATIDAIVLRLRRVRAAAFP